MMSEKPWILPHFFCITVKRRSTIEEDSIKQVDHSNDTALSSTNWRSEVRSSRYESVKYSSYHRRAIESISQN